MAQMRLLVMVAVVLLGVGASTVRTGAQDLAAGKERIRSWIAGILGKPPVLAPSVAIAVVQNGEIVWEEAFGWADQQRRIAATPATPYYLASVSKIFTSTALKLLANE